jgi:serine/threonine protein phosphatase PrpC
MADGPHAVYWEAVQMNLRFAGQTHKGRRRDHNEDAFELVAEANLFVVADGIGGNAAGEIASRLAVDSLAGFIRSYREDPDITWPVGSTTLANGSALESGVDPKAAAPLPNEHVIANAVQSANKRVWRAANKYAAYRGMATTVVSLMIDQGRAYVAHVGDSRCYRLRNGVLERITEDHSLLNAFLSSGVAGISEETFPMKNVILRAVGADESVEVDVRSEDALPGDLFLLCTDGLTGEINDDGILKAAEETADLDALVKRLVYEACEAGGRDNVTVVAVRVA